jgi:PAS domain S-box-containing protein
MIDQILEKVGNQLIELLTNSGYGICLTDEDLKLLWSNNVFRNWFQSKEQEYLFEIIEERESRDNSEIYQSITRSKSIKIEVKNPSTKRWFLISSSPIQFEPEKFFYLFLIDDTTEKKTVFESYISQLELLDNVEDGIFSTDFNNRVTYWNKGAEKIYGYSASEVVGKIINQDFKLFDPIDIETQIQITQELEKYRTYYFRRKEYRKDQIEIWIEGNVTLITDTGDNPIGLIYIVRDITAKLNAEILSDLNANLQKSLREITTNLLNEFSFSDITLQLTKKCKELTESEICSIFKINEHRSEIIEIISDKELTEESLNQLIEISFSILSWLELNRKPLVSFNEKYPEVIEKLRKIVGVEHFIISPVIIKNEIQYFILAGSNSYSLQNYKVEILNSFASHFSFIVSYFEKKLLQETLEDKLRQTQKYELTSNLISGIVHDFKNLLYGMKISVDLIKQKYESVIPAKIINELEAFLNRGLDLSKNLLEIGKPLKPVKTQFKLNKLLDEIYNFARQICPSGIIINKNYSDDLPEIYADYTQLYQVFMNLIVNARDAMPDGGELNIEVEKISITEKDHILKPKLKAGDFLVVTFSDTGHGIPKEHLDKIFEPYFTTKDYQKGTGLGLFISQNIITKHNGFIQVESEVGKGSKFKVYLPYLKSEEKVSQRVVETKIKSNPTILIADDEDSIRTLLAEMLSLQNFNVLEASSGEQAKELFIKSQDILDLVILDYHLKDTTGEEILKFIRERNKDIPVFIASGIIDDELSKRLNELLVDKIIEKPYEFDNLMESINNYIKIVS